MDRWIKPAFFKLARLGAIVFLPTSDGQFLFQEEEKGLRPPGGRKEGYDKTLIETIIREIREEFGISEEKVRKKVRFLGYEYRKPFWGNAVFELRGHGLKPGLYQASNHPDEKVILVKANLDDPRYVGPQPEKLITEAARDIGAKMLKEAKAGRPTLQFPMENHAQFPAEDKEAMQNIWLDIEDELHGKKKMEKEGDVDSVFGQEQAWKDPTFAKVTTAAKVIAVDLDATLAHRDSTKPFHPDHVGEPIDKMLKQVKKWIEEGKKVIIFTARASNPKNIPAVEAWLKKHGLEGLHVTHEKTPDIDLIVDDKAVGVEKNTGKLDDVAAERLGVKEAKYITEKELMEWAKDSDTAKTKRRSRERLVCMQTRRDPDGLEKKARMEDIPDYAARVAKVDPVTVERIDKYDLISRENGFHPANLLKPEEWEGFRKHHLDGKKEAKFHRPENYDPIKALSTKEYTIWCGSNDWESVVSWMWVEFNSSKKRVYARLDPPQELLDGDHWNEAWGKSVVRRWIRVAKEKLEISRKEMNWEHATLGPEDFISAAGEMKDVITECGLEKQVWQDVPTKKAAVKDLKAPTRYAPDQPEEKAQSTAILAPPATQSPEATSDETSPLQPPKTGPDAIYWALRNIDLNAKETEAKDILKRKLKSKRDGAVKILGIIDGLRRTGIKPHELMISKVPVIPPQFRPFTVAGDTFIPGDANELYRDLINMRGVNKEVGEKFGPKVGMQHGLHVYDAMKALYGFGEPTSPKTLERGVSGFLKKVSGSNPKWSFLIRKMTSKPQDYVGRSVVAVNPDYDMNTVGIPHDMAWTLYAPYVQRRLVRGGMTMTESVRHVRDRSENADRALDEEMKMRPVVYSRSPAWHKFSVVAGWPKRVEGNAVMVNPFITVGQNMDFDGDTVNVHTPAFHESVEDAKNKLMPDKMLFSIKKKNSIVPGLKQEQVLGIYQAQHRPAKNVHKFSNQAEALKAIQAGKVPLSDEVDF